jgi:DNA-directed RNA polymerase subunit M/transcription elongation factor TFIIS
MIKIKSGMAQKYHLKCPKCGYEFDLNYSQLNSLSDPDVGITWREGAHRFAVKCPECHSRSHYHISEDGKQLSTW